MRIDGTMVCPFRMQAGMMLDARLARIHVQGAKESARVEIDVNCIGEPCAFYLVTNMETKAGVCSPVLLGPVRNELIQLNQIRNTLVQTVTEAIEDASEATRSVAGRNEFDSSPTSPGIVPSFLRLLGEKLRNLLTPPPPPEKGAHLKPVPKEK